MVMSGLIIFLELMSSFATIADLVEALNKPIETARINVLGYVILLEVCRQDVQCFVWKPILKIKRRQCRAMQIYCLIRSMCYFLALAKMVISHHCFPIMLRCKSVRWGVHFTGPKPPFDLLTISPPVIAQAKSIFVLAIGTAKAAVLSVARQTPGNFNAVPARLVLGATWLLDTALTENIF